MAEGVVVGEVVVMVGGRVSFVMVVVVMEGAGVTMGAVMNGRREVGEEEAVEPGGERVEKSNEDLSESMGKEGEKHHKKRRRVKKGRAKSSNQNNKKIVEFRTSTLFRPLKISTFIDHNSTKYMIK